MKNPGNLFDKVLALNDQQEKKHLEIGKILSAVQFNGWHAPWKNFREFCVKSGVGYRKACYLVEIYNAVAEKLVPRADALKIGYSRMMILKLYWGTPLWTEWAVKGRDKSITDTALRGMVSGESDVTDVVFKLNARQRTALYPALRKFGALGHGRGLRGKEQALMAILVRACEADVQAQHA